MSAFEHIHRKPFGKFSLQSHMKVLSLIMLLMLLPLTTASSYTLGSHQVSFNVSEPYNSAARLDPPTYMPDSNCWLYTLNMTTDTQHAIMIYVLELSYADYGRTWPGDFARVRAQFIKDKGIGGYKSSTMDFGGYPAYQESFPAQTDMVNGKFIPQLETHGFAYETDERTVVQVLASGDNVPYQEILNTIEVTDAPKKPAKYAPYIGPIDGNGSSQKAA